ncbi:hypothetical protein Cgig2_003981 [Carnegiea gigantea]|uniref:Very-long-chain (3R)-3-hydroxyacyl-CoA dehydratase n=1 Tax=Carnegiea gigantea TaxID=171969 RepID=A0A9Q1KBI9_9CARY|nr:hypothetical protein Cgig2_003981 [Carnegiea gigantea]
MQWGGRTHYLLAIVQKIDEVLSFSSLLPWLLPKNLRLVLKSLQVQESPSIFATFVSWSICDFIRYSHYAMNCIGYCPHWSTFIRYTAFIPLYPLGAAGEVWLMYHALPYIREKDLYGDFFSYFPLSYYTFIQILLLCYPLCWGKLYVHLLKQRQSKLGKHHGKKRE